jgi:hypothetical protein
MFVPAKNEVGKAASDTAVWIRKIREPVGVGLEEFSGGVFRARPPDSDTSARHETMMKFTEKLRQKKLHDSAVTRARFNAERLAATGAAI